MYVQLLYILDALNLLTIIYSLTSVLKPFLPGEAMEKGLRDCCRSIRIGKILIRRDQETGHPRIYYAKFPPQIDKRQILLLLPVLGINFFQPFIFS